jgi:hypothetical protein
LIDQAADGSKNFYNISWDDTMRIRSTLENDVIIASIVNNFVIKKKHYLRPIISEDFHDIMKSISVNYKQATIPVSTPKDIVDELVNKDGGSTYYFIKYIIEDYLNTKILSCVFFDEDSIHSYTGVYDSAVLTIIVNSIRHSHSIVYYSCNEENYIYDSVYNTTKNVKNILDCKAAYVEMFKSNISRINTISEDAKEKIYDALTNMNKIKMLYFLILRNVPEPTASASSTVPTVPEPTDPEPTDPEPTDPVSSTVPTAHTSSTIPSFFTRFIGRFLCGFNKPGGGYLKKTKKRTKIQKKTKKNKRFYTCKKRMKIVSKRCTKAKNKNSRCRKIKNKIQNSKRKKFNAFSRG